MTDQPEALRWDMGDESSPPYPHADGDWVRYEDYERLREEIKRLRGAGTDQSVAIEPGEWLVLRDAIGRMVAECREVKL